MRRAAGAGTLTAMRCVTVRRSPTLHPCLKMCLTVGLFHVGACSPASPSQGPPPRPAKAASSEAVATTAAPVPEVDPCQAACAREGACTREGTSCIATSDNDCMAAAVCRNEARCLALDGVCSVACNDADACRLEGRCLRKGNTCVADELGCKNSVGCKSENRCVLVEERCVQGDGG